MDELPAKSAGSTHTPCGGLSNRDGLNECNNCQKPGKPFKNGHSVHDDPEGDTVSSQPSSSDGRTQSGGMCLQVKRLKTMQRKIRPPYQA
jgi:hypothetical protein